MLFHPDGHQPVTFQSLPFVMKLLSTCPVECTIPFILHAIPKDINKGDAAARCLSCMTYWEVTRDGIVKNIRLGMDVPIDHPLRQANSE